MVLGFVTKIFGNLLQIGVSFISILCAQLQCQWQIDERIYWWFQNQTKPPSRWKSRPYRFYYFLPGMEMLSSGYRLLKSSCLLNERNQILNKNKRKNNSIKENSQMVVQTIPLSSVSCYALNLNLLTCALDMYTYSKVHKTFHCIQINSSDDN